MIEVILNLAGFFLSLFATITGWSFCLFILFQRQHRQNLDLFLCAATFLAASLFSFSLFVDTVYTLKLDFSLGSNMDSKLCRFQAYIVCVAGSTSFYGYCLQAISRLIYVVYRQHLWLRTFKVYFLAVIFSWILSTLLLIPSLVAENFFIYLPNENYCLINFTNLSSMLYLFMQAVVIQCGTVSLVYFRLARFLHHVLLRNTNRELVVVRKIFYTVICMGSMNISNVIFWFMYLTTGYLHPMTYRIGILSYSIGTLMMNGAMIFINPRLKSLVFIRQRRVRPEVLTLRN